MKRRILSAITAIAMATTAMFGMTSSATGTPRDPTGDGVIALNDSIYINQFLTASVLPSNLTPLDFDQNGVITPVDAFKIQLSLLQLYTPPNAGENEPYNAAEVRTDSYMVHQCFYDENGNDISPMSYDTYDLQTTLSTVNNSRTIIGQNDMIRDSDTSVVRISSVGGSGFIVSNHCILTAAHCVYNKNDNKFIDTTVSIVDSNGNIVESYKPSYIHIPLKYESENYFNNQAPYDYALLCFDENLSEYGRFVLGCALDEYTDNHGRVVVSGFPSLYPEGYDNATYGLRFNAAGNLFSEDYFTGSNCSQFYTPELLYYSADTASGDSGGPVYVDEAVTTNGTTTSYKTVIGISTFENHLSHNREYNGGVKIEPHILNFVYSNEEIVY